MTESKQRSPKVKVFAHNVPFLESVKKEKGLGTITQALNHILEDCQIDRHEKGLQSLTGSK